MPQGAARDVRFRRIPLAKPYVYWSWGSDHSYKLSKRQNSRLFCSYTNQMFEGTSVYNHHLKGSFLYSACTWYILRGLQLTIVNLENTTASHSVRPRATRRPRAPAPPATIPFSSVKTLHVSSSAHCFDFLPLSCALKRGVVSTQLA